MSGSGHPVEDRPKNERIRCMFDTVAFNRCLDYGIPVESLARYVAAYATHIQRDELGNTKSDERRTALDKVFVGLSSELEVPTETAVFGVSRWGSSKWSSEPNLYTRIKSDLDELNGKKRNNVQDALIDETSIKCGLILVTDDQDLTVVTKKYGGKCLSFEGMLKEVIE